MYVSIHTNNFEYFVIHTITISQVQISKYLVHVQTLKAKHASVTYFAYMPYQFVSKRKRKTRFVERTKVHCFINVCHLDVYCLYEFRLDTIGMMFYIDHHYTILYHMMDSQDKAIE
ncbi:hypothetical protein V1478_011120 [Vespula squamosa]|uniref:Uncharacterized protein n=1 Tax=Vespula squamosa TaxID=30214 RepID=A0ABD2AGB7_VESSQ